jgi:hypothetical protein
MSFQEYLNNKAHKKQPSFSVEVLLSDCFLVYNYMNKIIVDLKLFDVHYEYIINPNETGMWTMDANGNRKKSSVFKLVTPNNV